jgi:hypothetical protein
VTEPMPARVGRSRPLDQAGGRHERPSRTASPISSSTWPSRGRRAQRLQIAEEIEDVGGYINAYTSRETTAYYARVLKNGRAARARRGRRHRAQPRDSRPGDRGRARRDPAGDRAGARHARRHHLRLAAGERPIPTSRSAGRSSAPRSASAPSGATTSPASSPSITAPDQIDPVGRGRGRSRRDPAPRPSASRPSRAPAGAGGGACEVRRRRAAGTKRSSRCMSRSPSRRRGRGTTRPMSRRSTRALGGGMSSRLFQELREARGLCYTVFAQAAPMPTPARSPSTAARAPAHAAVRGGDGRRAEARRRRPDRGGGRAGAGADAAGLLMSLESPSARAERNARLLTIWDRVPPVDETVARIDAVTPDAVRDFAGAPLRVDPGARAARPGPLGAGSRQARASPCCIASCSSAGRRRSPSRRTA